MLASGLYNEAFITGPTPDSNNVIYARNCVIEDTNPFTFDPKDLIIIFGTINPYIIAIICKIKVDIILYTAFLLLIIITNFLFW